MGSGHETGYRERSLAAGLAGLGVCRGVSLTVLVCREHANDRAVAVAAGTLLGTAVVVMDVEDPIEEIRAQLRACRGGVLLACSDGLDVWRRTGVPMRVVADGAAPGVLWWRTLELRQSTDVHDAAPAPVALTR